MSLNSGEHGWRRSVWWIGGLALVGVAVWGAWSLSSRPRPNVLLITLDTTRADRLGCYGDEQARTPALDALAAQGVLFERAYTPAPLTLPAHASLLSGLYPPEHGLITNGRGRLDDSVPTITNTLRRAGYETGAFVGSFVLHGKFGLNQKFDVYDDDMTNTDPTEHGLHRQRDGSRVVDRALDWLRKPRKNPFFCWVHLYDAHHPYQAHPAEFGDEFQERPYDGEIAYVDRLVGRLVDDLEQRRLREQTVIIVVGDHGESLGEHEEDEHSLTLYDATLRVPWIWAGPGVSVSGRKIPQTVSLVDFSPTVLELLGLNPLPQISGRSLRAALEGREIALRDCYGASDDPLLEHGWSPVRSLADMRWKYIRSTEPELYDLAADPRELVNLATEQGARLAEMESRLASLERSMTVRQSAAVQLSPQERRALESLGYLGGNSGADEDAKSGQALPDMKRMLPLANKVVQIRKRLSEGRPADAEIAARDLMADAPDYVDAQLILAESLLAQANFSECGAVLDEVISRHPDEDKAHFFRGLLAVAMNRREEAVGHFRTALEFKPDSTGALYNLGLSLLQLGEPREAQRYLEDVLDIDPAYVSALIGAGMALSAQGLTEQAMERYRTALSYDASSVEAHTNFAVLLAGQRRNEEAGQHFAAAALAAPGSAEARCNHGTYLLSIGKIPAAIVELSEAVRLDPQHPQAAIRLQQARSLQK